MNDNIQNDAMLDSLEEREEEELQLAENDVVEQDQKETLANEFEVKRGLLQKTKIVRQTWSISEIYQKIKDKKLILDPDYQRNAIWNIEKQTAFIESIYMEIMIPPIYVVEIPGEDILEETKYEVVDGKQRLTAIIEFIRGSYRLSERSLEYYSDIYGTKSFAEIRAEYPEKTSQMLSSILDIYVITANSPEFTKYDIFARLNRGAEKLKVNEIRRAIYRSKTLSQITEYVEKQLKDHKADYEFVFSKNDIKRYEDYGRLYRSLAFYVRSNLDDCKVMGYNSRPRDMINTVLQEIQREEASMGKQLERISDGRLELILDMTIWLRKIFKGEKNADYVIDSIIPFIDRFDLKCNEELVKGIIRNTAIKETLEKSPATTSNVDNRIKILKKIFDLE